MIIHNPILTGSFTFNGTDVSSVTGSSTYSASFASSINSLNAATASLNSFSASVNTFTASAATTGSNTFVGNQVVTGSLNVSGSITTPGTLTAQTLVVQTITSSVDFVTGSTRFGSVIGNTHVFTGSVSITGSLSGIGATFSSIVGVNGASEAGWALKSNGNLKVEGSNGTTVLQINDTATGGKTWSLISSGNGNTHSVPTGSFYIRNSSDGTTALTVASSGNIGIGTTNPHSLFEVYAGSGSVFRAVYNGVNNIEIGNYKTTGTGGGGYQQLDIASSQINLLTGTAGGGSATSRIFISSSGFVGIGTTNPSFILDVNDTNASGVRGIRISASSSTVGPGLFLYINSGAQTNWIIGNSYEIGSALEFRSSNSVGGNPGSAGTTRMLITSGGNVGIGTNSPNGLLSLKASLSDTPVLRFQNNITSGLDAALSTYVSSTQTYLAIGTNCYINSTGNIVRFNTSYESSFIAFDSGDLRFSTGTTSANPVTKLNIASSGKMTIDQSAYFVCGTTGFRFNNSTDAFNNFVALDNGNATLRGTLTQNSSDERLKNNIQTIPNALNKINQLKGVTFEWNQELYETSRTTDIGVIAQDVQKVLPDAVTLAPFDTNFEDYTSKSGENYLTVYYEKLIPLLIEGIKELKAEFDEYKLTHP